MKKPIRFEHVKPEFAWFGSAPPARRATTEAMAVVVHLLVNGRMACGLDDRPPQEWPAGQLWVSADKAAAVSCAACQRVAGKLGADYWL